MNDFESACPISGEGAESTVMEHDIPGTDQQIKAGLLPLYAELYDRVMADKRGRVEAFLHLIQRRLTDMGLDLTAAPVCRLRDEFDGAIRQFEAAGVECVITLHLAYSPSLECIEALAGSKLPVVVLDTTPALDFGPRQNPQEIFTNHGIHGVQDLCNLLIRRGKPFDIEAGHWEASNVLERTVRAARAASVAARIGRARVGRIGKPFAGMGDFAISSEELAAELGAEVVVCEAAKLREMLAGIGEDEIRREMESDLKRFEDGDVDAEAHRETTRACLAVRKWMQVERLSAFSVNFLEVDRASGIPAVPFLEASKAMARGLGYAGEGDVLTAALCGALGGLHPASFTEMFCPDWEGGTVLLSHMGEMNLNLVAGRPDLLEKPFPWTDAANPVVALGCFKAGPATLVNVAPLGGGRFVWTVVPGEMIDGRDGEGFKETVRGWFRPRMPLPEMLKAYSEGGGTHHSALVYGAPAAEMEKVGRHLGWQTRVLDLN